MPTTQKRKNRKNENETKNIGGEKSGFFLFKSKFTILTVFTGGKKVNCACFILVVEWNYFLQFYKINVIIKLTTGSTVPQLFFERLIFFSTRTERSKYFQRTGAKCPTTYVFIDIPSLISKMFFILQNCLLKILCPSN